MKNEDKKILVFSDCHVSNETYKDTLWHNLGLYIVLNKPDVIVCLGDFAEVKSLHPYGKSGTLEEDLNIVEYALKQLMHSIIYFNGLKRKQKKRMYQPNLYMCMGNHEEWDKSLRHQDLYERFGFTTFPYREVLQLGSVYFAHNFTLGRTDKAIAATGSKTLLKDKHCTCVAGHSHCREFFEEGRLDGKLIQSVITGTFSPEEYRPEWAGQSVNEWWHGFTMLTVGKEYLDVEFISNKRMLKELRDEEKKISDLFTDVV